MVSDAIGALQAFVRDEDTHDDRGVPSIALLRIRRGSAVYQCVARSPESVVDRLRLVGAIIDSAGKGRDEPIPPSVVTTAVPTIKALSEVAKRADCEVILRRRTTDSEPESPAEVIARISPMSYSHVRDHYTSRGETQIYGELKRVGGATRPRCMIRVAGQSSALYCDVTAEQARTLASYLYSRVVLRGTATWLTATGTIIDFHVEQIVDYRITKFDEIRRRLRDAGAAGWDARPDSDAFLTGDVDEAAG